MQNNNPFARIKKPLKSDMNVVPYIDVMLVLLVIFMVTAPMITTAITVNLPEATSDAISTSQQQVAIVTMKPNKQFFVRLGKGQDAPLSLDDIEDFLAEEQDRLQIENRQLLVLVNGDKNIAYGEVMALMSMLQQSGLKQVGLLTQAPSIEQTL